MDFCVSLFPRYCKRMPKARQLHKDVSFVSQFWHAKVEPASGMSADFYAGSGYHLGREREYTRVSFGLSHETTTL